MSLFEEAVHLEKQNKPFAIVSIIKSSGSAPRNKGRMIVLPSGKTLGTIGGGPAEKMVTEAAVLSIQTGESKTLSYRLNKDSHSKGKQTVQMICGGDMDFFIEVFSAKPALYLAGAGHVNHALSRLADFLGYPYIISDIREEMIKKDRYPHALAYITDNHPDSSENLILKGIDQGLIGPETALIIATHNHDKTALRGALKSQASYIGMLGSKRKAFLTLKALGEEGIEKKELNRVYTPVGLDLQSETPEEIAISVMAEIMKVQNKASGLSLTKNGRPSPLVLVRGAGDIATGTIARLHQCGFKVVALDIDEPTVIRRTIAFAQALVEPSGTIEIEDMKAQKVTTLEEVYTAFKEGVIPVIPDPKGEFIKKIQPDILIDGILAKKNLGTHQGLAPTVIALGPGFNIDNGDAHAIVETKRGHHLGRVLYKGSAAPNTGEPGQILGFSKERVIHAPQGGTVRVLKDIGSLVHKGDIIATINKTSVLAPLDGVVRGMIAPGTLVPQGLKMADIDPRGDISYCHSISDKARAVSGGVLEAIFTLAPHFLLKEYRGTK